jgi:hypothetical protein
MTVSRGGAPRRKPCLVNARACPPFTHHQLAGADGSSIYTVAQPQRPHRRREVQMGLEVCRASSNGSPRLTHHPPSSRPHDTHSSAITHMPSPQPRVRLFSNETRRGPLNSHEAHLGVVTSSETAPLRSTHFDEAGLLYGHLPKTRLEEEPASTNGCPGSPPAPALLNTSPLDHTGGITLFVCCSQLHVRGGWASS